MSQRGNSLIPTPSGAVAGAYTATITSSVS
jgi:hypothetical protein